MLLAMSIVSYIGLIIQSSSDLSTQNIHAKYSLSSTLKEKLSVKIEKLWNLDKHYGNSEFSRTIRYEFSISSKNLPSVNILIPPQCKLLKNKTFIVLN